MSVKNYFSVYVVFKGEVFLKRPQVAVTNSEIKYAKDLADEGPRFRIRIHENLLSLSKKDLYHHDGGKHNNKLALL